MPIPRRVDLRGMVRPMAKKTCDESSPSRRPLIAAIGLITQEKRIRSSFILLIQFIAIGTTWEAATVLLDIPMFVLPAPSQVVAAFKENLVIIATNTAITGSEVFLGLGLAVFYVSIISIPIGLSYRLYNNSVPYFIILQSVPLVMIAPLLVYWTGIGIWSKIVLASILASIPIGIRVGFAFWRIGTELELLVDSLSASSLAAYVYLRIPAAAPVFIDSFRLAVPAAVVGALVGEFIASDGGLGYMMLGAAGQLDIPLAFACLFIIALFTSLVHPFLHLVERKLTPWSHSWKRGA